MPSDHLVIEINPVILEALSIPGDKGSVDYFEFLGLKQEELNEAKVEAAVLDRTKELRRWQNSPQHGKEVVKLLPLLHRIASVLKDPVRRNAYLGELENFRRGDLGDPVEDFRDMVRAALVDGTIDNKSKAELLRYAEQHDIDQAEAGRILNEFTKATAGPTPAEAESEALFQVQEGGREEFRRNLQALLSQGRLTLTAGQKAVAQAEAFSIQPEEAEKLLHEVRVEHFRALIERVADGGAISNNQARLLMPKAQNLGLDADSAYEIISNFTFTGASRDELSDISLLSAGFDASEIDHLLDRHETIVYQPQRKGAGEFAVTAFKILLPLLLLGGLASGAFWGMSQLTSGGSAVVATPTPTVTPTPTPTGPWRPPLPDPSSGFLLFERLEENDPASFQAKIKEVTCREYKRFLVSTLYPNRPENWGIDYSFPEGFENRPVTGISAEDAREYCAWRAGKLGLASERVRLPSVAEYRRMLKGRNPDQLHPLEDGFWESAGLSGDAARDAGTTRGDTLLMAQGQMYDLVGNVAEWAADEAGRAVVVGGSIHSDPTGLNLEIARAAWDGAPEDRVGFRVVIAPPAALE